MDAEIRVMNTVYRQRRYLLYPLKYVFTPLFPTYSANIPFAISSRCILKNRARYQHCPILNFLFI